jgi:hypothetical protein
MSMKARGRAAHIGQSICSFSRRASLPFSGSARSMICPHAELPHVAKLQSEHSFLRVRVKEIHPEPSAPIGVLPLLLRQQLCVTLALAFHSPPAPGKLGPFLLATGTKSTQLR